MSTVVDASVIVALWIDPESSRDIAERLRGSELHAPEHVLVEASNALRRRRNSGLLTATQADDALAGVLSLPAELWPFRALAARVWELGANASSYDGAYIALAERLGATLLTRDVRLSRVPHARCAIETI